MSPTGSMPAGGVRPGRGVRGGVPSHPSSARVSKQMSERIVHECLTVASVGAGGWDTPATLGQVARSLARMATGPARGAGEGLPCLRPTSPAHPRMLQV